MPKRQRVIVALTLLFLLQVTPTFVAQSLRVYGRKARGARPAMAEAVEAVEAAQGAAQDAVQDLLAILGTSLSWIYVFLLGALTLVAGLGQIFQINQSEEQIPGVRFGLGDRVAAEAMKRREELEEGVEIVEDEGDDFRQEVVEAETRDGPRVPLPAWLAELETEGFDVDLTVYDSLIESAARSGDLSLAQCWLRQAVKMKFQPEAKTFEVMALAAAKASDLNVAMEWLERAEDAGARPTKATYTAFIEAAAKKGDLAAAELWFHRAEDAGIKADAAILTALRRAAVNISDASEARDELPDDIDILGQDTFVELKDEPREEVTSEAWLDKLKVTDLDVDEQSGSEMLISACRTGDLEAAEFWLNKCRKLKLHISPEAHQAVIDLTGRCSTFEACQRLAEEAKRQQVKLNRSSYSALIISACNSKNWEAAQQYFDEAMAENLALSGLALHKVVRLALQSDAELAEKCFAEASARGAKPEVQTFRALAVHAASTDLEEAERWMRLCRAQGLQPDAAAFVALVKAYVQRGDLAAAGRTFKESEAEGEPPVSLLSWLLRNLAFKDLDLAKEMLHYGLDRGMIPDAASFTALVRASLAAGEPQAAEEILSLGVRYGVRPEQEAFDTFIACGDLLNAEKWFARMRKFQVPASQATFSGLVEAAARVRDLPMAEYWYDEALKVGIQMEGPSYAQLVQAAELLGDDAAAQKWFGLVRQRQESVKTGFMEKLLSMHLEKDDLKQASSWLQRGLEEGLDLDAHESLGRIFRKLIRSQKLPVAEKWFQHCRKASIPVSDSILVEVINSLAIAGDWKGAGRWYQSADLELAGLKFDRLVILASRGGDYPAAERWLHRAMAAGEQPDAMAYVALVHGAAETAFQGAKAEQYFQAAVDSGLKPTVNLYTPLVRRFAQDGDMAKAEAWFQRILEAGLKPGIFPYTSLVSGFLRQGQLDKAEEWLRISQEAGLASDSVMYSALIDGYCNEGSSQGLQKAMNLLEAMASSGKAKPRLILKLMRRHAQRGDVQAASRCADLMEDVGFKVRRSEYFQLLKACAKSSREDRDALAEKLLRQMMADGVVPDESTVTLLEPVLGRRYAEILEERPGQPKAEAAKVPLAELLHSAKGSSQGETMKVLEDLQQELGS